MGRHFSLSPSTVGLAQRHSGPAGPTLVDAARAFGAVTARCSLAPRRSGVAGAASPAD
jgi:hypothetical protein